jgi:branched-chain amino acid transport system substrate-binding protein
VRLSRLERLFIATAAMAVVLTVGFGAGLYHALTTRTVSTSLVAPSPGSDSALATATPEPTGGAGAGGPGSAGSAGSAGTAAKTVTRGGQATPVPPTVCPYPGGTMTVGSIVSLTGFFQFPEAANAAKAYFQNANAHGGVHGCRVTDEVLDDATDPSTGRIDAKQLVADDHVLSIVSMVAPFSQDTIDPYFNAPGGDNAGQAVPVVGLDPYEENAYKFPNEFGVDVPIYDAGTLMAQYAKQHITFSHPGIFGYKVTQLQAAEDGAVAQFKKDGYSNTTVELVDPSSGDYNSIASDFQSQHVDLLMWFCDIGCGTRFVKAAQANGYHPNWVNYEIGYDQQYAQQFGGSGGEMDGAAVISPFLPFESGSAATTTMFDTVEHYFPGTRRDSVMEQGWLGAQLFATTVSRLPLTGNLQHDQSLIVQALAAETNLDLGLTPPLDFQAGIDPRYSGRVAHRCAQFVVISGGALRWQDRSWHCPP